jgi:hypothetical protein
MWRMHHVGLSRVALKRVEERGKEHISIFHDAYMFPKADVIAKQNLEEPLGIPSQALSHPAWAMEKPRQRLQNGRKHFDNSSKVIEFLTGV